MKRWFFCVMSGLSAALVVGGLTSSEYNLWLAKRSRSSEEPRGYGTSLPGHGLMPCPRRGGRWNGPTSGRGNAKPFPLRVDSVQLAL